MVHIVVFVRHGDSEWNSQNKFCGWFDADLSTIGVQEAKLAGKLLHEKGYKFDLIFTSLLKRAIKTTFLIQEEMDNHHVDVVRNWKLNERMYGGLTGLNKSETAKKYGEEKVMIWRRSYDTRPPDVEVDSEYYPLNDEKYKNLDKSDIPRAECLKDTLIRALPYWENEIVPEIKKNKRVLVSAHGNSIRALIKEFDDISDDKITSLNIPTGVPLVYEFDNNMKKIKSYYLITGDELQQRIDKIYFTCFYRYAITHASRKALSGTKPELLQVWTNYDTDNIYDMQSLYTSEEEVQNFFGYLDMSFCLAYALGMYFFGFIGNKYNPVNIIAIGSICSGIYTIFFGYIAYTIKIDWPGYFIILWLLNGFFQASIFPNMVAIVSNWFDKDKAGIVFGIWSANAAIGNILGELLAYLAKLIGFSYLYLICGILMISIGIQYKFGLVLSPLSVFEGLHSQYTFKLMDENETLNNYSFAPDNETEILNESSMSNRLNTIENTVIINSNRRKKNCGILSIFIDVILKPQVLPYTITYSLSK
ncbi:hypothetical protein A3Q56_04818, partial [Intoshia linei]